MADPNAVFLVLAAIVVYVLFMKLLGKAYDKLLSLALRYLEFLVFVNLTDGTLWRLLQPYVYRAPELLQELYYKYNHVLSGFGTGGGTTDLRPL